MLIHGLTETKTEDTDKMILNVINDKLNIKMSQISIGRSHRLGRLKGPVQKSRVIIVRFTGYKDRHHVVRNKRLLKGNGISVTECPTLKRMEQLKKAREQHGFVNAWATGWKIMFK